jgi:hypothetical protein
VSNFAGGELDLIDACAELCFESVEGSFEGVGDSAQAGKSGSQAWAQESIVDTREE